MPDVDADWTLPLVLPSGGALGGLVLQRLVVTRLRAIAARTRWRGDDVILRARRLTDQHFLKHEFVKRLHARYAAEAIRIPFPTRTIEMAGARVADG